MQFSQVEQAARNNAIWCDTLCRAHGAPGEFHEAAWLNRQPVPRFYPNLVTIANRQSVATKLVYVQDLIASNLPRPWAVKDSFCELSLDTLTFQLLFEANWLWRASSEPIPKEHVHNQGLDWVRLQNESELVKWEMAWSGGLAENSAREQTRLFPSMLLADPDIAFIAAYQGGKIVAGAIANRTENVVGLSNVFALSEDHALAWIGCISTANKIFPGLSLAACRRGP